MTLVATIYISYKLGGYDVIFHGASTAQTKSGNGGIVLSSPQYLGYSTLSLGFALALFLYPHAVTSMLAARNRDVVKKNMAILPAHPSCSASTIMSHSPKG